MASTPVEFKAPTGLSLTLKLFAYGSDVLANTGGDTATEATNCKGRYSATVTEALSGWYDAVIVDGSANLIAAYSVYMVDDTAIKRCHDIPSNVLDLLNTGTAGSGADQVTLNWTNTTTGLPVADGDAWVTTDAAGTNVVAGTLQTDSAGDVTFLLTAGLTYYAWFQKDGVDSILGQSFVAVAD